MPCIIKEYKISFHDDLWWITVISGEREGESMGFSEDEFYKLISDYYKDNF